MKWQALLAMTLALLIVTAGEAKDIRLTLRAQARALLEQDRFDEAIKLYGDAAASAEDDAVQAHCLVEASEIALSKSKDADRALALAGQIRDEKLRWARELVLLARAKRYDPAIERFGETDLSTWPEEVRMDAMASRGESWLAKGDAARALADLDAASQLPGDASRKAWVCFQLGQLQEKASNVDAALQAYQRGIDATRGNYAWRNRCFNRYHELLLERGEVKPVLDACAAVDVSKLPGDYWRGEFLLLHARAQAQAGNRGQAIGLYTAVLRLPEAVKGHKTAAEARIAELTAAMSQP